MPRLALISDIHGNCVGLDAVLADATVHGAGGIVCLGDVAAGGPQPREVIRRLRQVGCRAVRGNADGWLLDGLPPGRSEATRRLGDVVSWACALLTADERVYLATLPPTLTIAVGDWTLLCCHGSAGRRRRHAASAPAPSGPRPRPRPALPRAGRVDLRPPAGERATGAMSLSRARRLPGPAPDRLPLRPLAALRRPAPGPRNPRRENRRVASEEGAELQLSAEVDVEPGLRAGLVADGEAAGVVALEDVVGVGEIGTDSVDAQTEETARHQARLGGADVLMGSRAIAVLEDLNAHDECVFRPVRQRAQVAMDQSPAPAGRARRQLVDRRRRDVEADQIEAAGYERQVVAAVAAADVDARLADQIVIACGGEDVGDERQRRLLAVAAGVVLNVPGLRSGAQLVALRHHSRIV